MVRMAVENSPNEERWRCLYPFASRFLDLDGVKYHYLDEGAGPLAGVDDFRCHSTHTNNKAGTAMRTMRRTRIGSILWERWSTARPPLGSSNHRCVCLVNESRQESATKMRIHHQELIGDFIGKMER